MNLIWHMARKDLRRMALPVAVWLVFLTLPTLWLSGVHVPEHVIREEAIMGWAEGLRALLALGTFLQLLGAALLTGYLGLEDSVVGTTAHWLTRPVAGGRLMAAKLVAAALLFVVAPVLLLWPSWLRAGFNGPECLTAALDYGMRQGVVVLGSLALASLVRNLAQFAGVLAAYPILLLFIVSRMPANWLGYPAAYNGSFAALCGWVVVPSLAVALIVQYCTRSARRGWAILALSLLVLALVRLYWPIAHESLPPGPKPLALELPLRAGAEISAGGRSLRLAGFLPDRQGGAAMAVLEERKQRSGIMELKSWSSTGVFDLREQATRTSRLMQADMMSALVQNGITLRVWRLTLLGHDDWPADGVIVNEVGTEGINTP